MASSYTFEDVCAAFPMADQQVPRNKLMHPEFLPLLYLLDLWLASVYWMQKALSKKLPFEQDLSALLYAWRTLWSSIRDVESSRVCARLSFDQIGFSTSAHKNWKKKNILSSKIRSSNSIVFDVPKTTVSRNRRRTNSRFF